MPLSRFFRFFAGLTFAVMLGCALLKAAESKTSGSISGTVKDSTGGVIPGATITATDEAGIPHAVESGADGHYVLRNLSPGTYKVTAQYTGLQPTAALLVQVKSGHAAAGDIVMTVKEQKQEVTVSETGSNQVSTEAANNVSALVLRQADLDALPDDPDDLQADLEALAGPSAGPRGPQIFIDGFTGGRMPPKSSIREIRINSNPFSAEYDKLGFGRIEIFTKPGTDKFHGTGYFGTSDGVWNSRNPFLTSEPPFMTQLFGGNVSGPLSRKASFFIDFDRRNIDDNGIVNATIPTDTLLSTQLYQGFYSTPQRRTTISPRVDYQLASNNALSMRYAYLSNDRLLTGIGNFDLPETTIGSLTLASAGYTQSMNEHLLQLVDTAVLGPNLLNETHFQYARDEIDYRSQSTTPQLNVANSFVAGGSGYSAPGYPASYGVQSQYELQNYTSVTAGAHTVKFGIRIRADELRDYAPNNFNGTYAFLGGSGLSSIDQYLTTLQLLNAGYTSRQVTAMGFGPSQYSVSTGNPLVSFSQLDFGPFVQDDWRVKPNLTLSFGLRWEAQTNISDKNDWAPRFSFAWSPDAKSSRGRAKTVIRGGWGMFYDRFQAEDVLNAYRYNGANQINYIIKNPTDYNSAFSLVPSLAGIPASNVEQRYQIDSNLQAPRLMQAVIGVERQLFGHTTMSVNLVNSRGVHELRTVDINAPLPGTNNTVRPYGNIGDIYDYQSTGIFKQTQLAVSLNSMIGRRVTLFSRYSYSTAHSNTDGLTTMPANPYDFSQEWGPSSLDIRQMLFLGGSISGLWGLRLSPFFIAHSGMPFNITTGTDLYGVGQIASTARPAVVSGPGPNIIDTPFGYLDVLPQPGQVLIERNAGIAPGFIELNLRLSKTWGFGTTKFEGPSGGTRARQGGGSPDGGGPGGGHGGGMRGGGFGGPGGGGPPPGGGPGGMFGGGTEHRYNLTLSISARNAINHENLGVPVGVITSPYFLQSTGITGGFGPESVASNQRRIDIQLRFTF
jgi:hypothetical protein